MVVPGGGIRSWVTCENVGRSNHRLRLLARGVRRLEQLDLTSVPDDGVRVRGDVGRSRTTGCRHKP
jgi:hypothetical protein